jgi:hypothetical protein
MYRVTQGLKAESFYLVEFIGAQGQNRTADTGIFNVNKINNLLILLPQAIRGTVRQNQVDSIACVSLAKAAESRRCTAAVPRIRRKPIKKFYQQSPRDAARRRFVMFEDPAWHAA